MYIRFVGTFVQRMRASELLPLPRTPVLMLALQFTEASFSLESLARISRLKLNFLLAPATSLQKAGGPYRPAGFDPIRATEPPSFSLYFIHGGLPPVRLRVQILAIGNFENFFAKPEGKSCSNPRWLGNQSRASPRPDGANTASKDASHLFNPDSWTKRFRKIFMCHVVKPPASAHLVGEILASVGRGSRFYP